MIKIMRFQSFFSRISGLIFICLLLVFGYFYDFHKIISLEPQSIHAWRQSDCVSFALNYCMEDRGLLEPSIHFIGGNDNGKTVSEFPIVYYTIGKIWRITGQHEFIYRGFVLALFFFRAFCTVSNLNYGS